MERRASGVRRCSGPNRLLSVGCSGGRTYGRSVITGWTRQLARRDGGRRRIPPGSGASRHLAFSQSVTSLSFAVQKKRYGGSRTQKVQGSQPCRGFGARSPDRGLGREPRLGFGVGAPSGSQGGALTGVGGGGVPSSVHGGSLGCGYGVMLEWYEREKGKKVKKWACKVEEG